MSMSSSSSRNPANALTIIITGASRGIGKEIATLFAQAGYRLLLTARDEKRLQQTVQSLATTYPASVIHGKAVDLSLPQEATAFGRWCLTYGEPDILINNAGISMRSLFKDVDLNVIDSLMKTNFQKKVLDTETQKSTKKC